MISDLISYEQNLILCTYAKYHNSTIQEKHNVYKFEQFMNVFLKCQKKSHYTTNKKKNIYILSSSLHLIKI